MKRKIFIWWFPLLIVLCSAGTDISSDKKFLKNVAENIYGEKIKIEKILCAENSVLIVANGATCHDCLTFTVNEAVSDNYEWPILYLIDGNRELSTSNKRDIIISLKKNIGGNAGFLNDKRIYFLPRSKFRNDITKFPVVLKSNREWVLYDVIWEAMTGKGKIFQK